MNEPLSSVIESYYLETRERLYFAVKGLVHPPDRFLSILRYVPDVQGNRQKERRNYRRIYHFSEQYQILKDHYPQYLAHEPTTQLILQSVPHSSIQKIYDPSARLQEIAQSPNPDPLERDALEFSQLLARAANVPENSLGVSGSILIGLHTGQSDLDMTVFGEQNCRAVHRCLQKLLDNASIPGFSRLDDQGLQSLYQERVKDTFMDFDDFAKMEKRKSFQGTFRGRTYFLRYVKYPHEIGEKYGEYRYRPLGRAGILATVTSDEEAIFTPCRYPLADVQLQQDLRVGRIKEIVSYRGRFCEQARAGERIYAFGMVERVQTPDGDIWHRLILGNQPEDTMILWR